MQVLYPDCHAESALFEAVCHNINLNIGIVRLAVYILIPSIIALFVVISCSSIVHSFERRERARMMAKYEEEKAQMQDEHKAQMQRQKLSLAVAKLGKKPSRKAVKAAKGSSGPAVAVQSQSFA